MPGRRPVTVVIAALGIVIPIEPVHKYVILTPSGSKELLPFSIMLIGTGVIQAV